MHRPLPDPHDQKNASRPASRPAHAAATATSARRAPAFGRYDMPSANRFTASASIHCGIPEAYRFAAERTRSWKSASSTDPSVLVGARAELATSPKDRADAADADSAVIASAPVRKSRLVILESTTVLSLSARSGSRARRYGHQRALGADRPVSHRAICPCRFSALVGPQSSPAARIAAKSRSANYTCVRPAAVLVSRRPPGMPRIVAEVKVKLAEIA